MEFKFIENFTASQYYNQVVKFRKEVLFAGSKGYLPANDKKDDEQSRHFAAFDNDILLGYVRLTEKNGTGRLTRVFVYEKYSGRGVGRAMINSLIDYCKSIKLNSLELYSRLDAVDFYRKLGFLPAGEEVISSVSGLKLCKMILKFEDNLNE